MVDQINVAGGINLGAAAGAAGTTDGLAVAASDSTLSSTYGSVDSTWSDRFDKQSQNIVDSADPTASANAALALNSLTVNAYSALTSGTPDLTKVIDSQASPVGASTLNSAGQRETKSVETFVDVAKGEQFIQGHTSDIFGAGVNVSTLSDLEKAQKISDYVAKNAVYTPDASPNWATVDQFVADGLKGDCEDIANFTASLMRGAGLTSDQVNVGVDVGAPGHVSVILNLDGNSPKVLDVSSQAANHSVVSINDLQDLSAKEVGDPFEVIYSDKGVVKTDGSHVFDNGVSDATAGTKNILASDGTTVVASGSNYADALDAFVKGHMPKPYTNDPKLSLNQNANAATANMISGLTEVLTDMAIMISDNATMMEDAGALFLIQQKMQKIKDAIAAVTASMKMVNDALSAALTTFTRDFSR